MMDVELMKQIYNETKQIIFRLNRSEFNNAAGWRNIHCEDVEYVYGLNSGERYMVTINCAPADDTDLQNYIMDELHRRFSANIEVITEW